MSDPLRGKRMRAVNVAVSHVSINDRILLLRKGLGAAPERRPPNRSRWRAAMPAAPASPRAAPAGLSGDDEIDGLGPLALLVGLDIERDALPLGQRFEPGALDRRDMHEHVAATVIRFNEAVAALRIEELDYTGHGHRETPPPWLPPPSAPTARRRGRTFAIGEGIGLFRPLLLRRPPQEAERQSHRRQN